MKEFSGGECGFYGQGEIVFHVLSVLGSRSRVKGGGIVNGVKDFEQQWREDAKLGWWRFFILISNSFILLA